MHDKITEKLLDIETLLLRYEYRELPYEPRLIS